LKTSLAVSPKGQVTLPASVRKRLGILPGGLVNLEERDGQLVLTPAAVVEIEMYSDAQIQRLADEDTWKPGEKEAWRRRLKKRKA
jgi:antitoxin PrlF